METCIIRNTKISHDHLLNKENTQMSFDISPNIITQIQFLMNRTDELKTVLKEMDEILNRIKEESLKNLSLLSED